VKTNKSNHRALCCHCLRGDLFDLNLFVHGTLMECSTLPKDIHILLLDVSFCVNFSLFSLICFCHIHCLIRYSTVSILVLCEFLGKAFCIVWVGVVSIKGS